MNGDLRQIGVGIGVCGNYKALKGHERGFYTVVFEEMRQGVSTDPVRFGVSNR
jgi:hypothetical protein